MKKVHGINLTILLNILFAGTLFGQDTGKSDSVENKETKVQIQNSTPVLKTPRLSYSMEVGAGFVGASNLFSGTYTNIAPSVNYLVSPKLKIEVGGIYVNGNTNFKQNSLVRQNSNMSLNTNQYFVYSQGQYAINNRLVLTGSLYTTLNSNKTLQINPYFLDYRGMNLGLDYKIGNHMTIGAQFRMSSGYNEYLFDNAGIGSFHNFMENKSGW